MSSVTLDRLRESGGTTDEQHIFVSSCGRDDLMWGQYTVHFTSRHKPSTLLAFPTAGQSFTQDIFQFLTLVYRVKDKPYIICSALTLP